jgi:hypothetical protein
MTDIRIQTTGRDTLVTGAHRGTTLMRLLSRALGDAGPLDRFIASRRVPGDRWHRWSDIADDIATATGERFSGESVRQWAVTLGIPQDTGKNDGAIARGAFLDAISKQGIPYV